MRIKLLVAGLLVASGVLVAQEDPYVTKIVRVHGDAAKLRDLACSGLSVNCDASEPLRAIVVKARSKIVAQIEQTIQQLDSISPSSASSNSGKNVELTVYVIGGSTQPFIGVPDVTGETLTPVVKQLRAIFPYSHYQLLSTMVIRSSLNGKADTSGMIGVRLNPNVSRPSTYDILYDSAKVSGEGVGSIHLANFRFGLKVPYVSGSLNTSVAKPGEMPYETTQYQQIDIGLQTDVDLREGQKVVVGKTNVSDSDSCFFLVLVARLVP